MPAMPPVLSCGDPSGIGPELAVKVRAALGTALPFAWIGDPRHLPPGTVLRIGGDQVPRMLASKLSPHQVGLLDVLTAARLLEDEPDVVEVVGVVPALLGPRVGRPRLALDQRKASGEAAVRLIKEAGPPPPGGSSRRRRAVGVPRQGAQGPGPHAERR